MQVRAGMEASGQARWFDDCSPSCTSSCGIGDAAEIRTKRVRKQKTDRQDETGMQQCLSPCSPMRKGKNCQLVADNPGDISFCLNLEFHAKIAK